MHLTVQHGLHPFDGDITVFQALVQIDEDRYGGCYSGSAFTAWPGVAPLDIGDDDCEVFWGLHGNALHGKGATPQQAFRDLVAKIKASPRPWIPQDELKLLLVVGLEKTVGFTYGSFDFYLWLYSDQDEGQRGYFMAGDPSLDKFEDPRQQGPRLIDTGAQS